MFSKISDTQWQYNEKGLTVGLTYRSNQQYEWQATVNGVGFSANTAKEALDKALKHGIQQRMMAIQRTDKELAVLAALYEREHLELD